MSAISTFLNQIKTAIYGEQVRDAIHDSILQCYTDVTNAKTLADQSTTSANNAAASANSAATKANNAAQSATTAANTANAAANNADNAKNAANSAASVATSAANQANDATTAANAAVQAANTAKDNAVTATTAANTATEAANAAAESANTAATNATDAANAALTAKDDANALLFTHGVVENASGSLVSFYDGADDMPMKKLEVSFGPVQDLHGYDHPWPGGGGKNKFDKDNCTTWAGGGTKLYNSGSLGTININGEQFAITDRDKSYGLKVCLGYFAAGTYTFSVLNKTESSIINVCFTDDEPKNGSNYSDTIKAPDSSSKYITFTINSPKYVYGGIYANSTSDLSFDHLQIEEGSEATEWTPYSNICPISGWTGVKVTKTGKNLFNKSNYSRYPGYLDKASGKIVYNNAHTIVYMRCEPNTDYTISRNRVDTNERFGIAFSTELPASGVEIKECKIAAQSGTVDERMTLTRTSPADAAYLLVWAWWTSGNADAAKETMQIEIGSTATDYEPYQGETYEVTFPSEAGTVYGGSLDLTTGVLTVDRIHITYDGTENWQMLESKLFRADALSILLNSASRNRFDRFKTSNISVWGSAINGYAGVIARRVWFKNDTKWTSLEEWVAYLQEQAANGTPLTAVLVLAAPRTYQLTPQEVKTLLGENNVFADAGDVNVDYIADTKLYIDKKFTELQALVLENVGG